MKLYIFIRKDLPKGKACVASAHAALLAIINSSNYPQEWIMDGMPKIVLSVENEEELIKRTKNIVRDAGRTVVVSGEAVSGYLWGDNIEGKLL